MGSLYESIGFLTILYLVVVLLYKIARGLWTCGLAAKLGFGVKWRGGKDVWAVITGSTDGIGLEYAKQMARKGYSLLLISRNAEKLEKTKDEIKSKYPQCDEIKTLAVDFTKSDIYDKIESEISKLENVDVLVNNVGISYAYAEYFTRIPDGVKLLDNIVNVNIVSIGRLILMVLPKMEKQKRGIIINVSSLSGSYPTPLLSAYAASKAYVDYLSRALQLEYADKGIIIQSVLPSFVATNMSKIRRPSLFIPSPSQYVSGALATTGVETRTYGYWTHKLQGFVLDVLISRTVGEEAKSKLTFNQLKTVRAKYYKKFNLKDKAD